ncbi:hypothetical protein [Pectobacterium carotovorum]|uniref:hypothetical protein n=1 Tax=Pectobacterium carotovorum TaxID=554 RepID=UPI00103AABB6|nr:hypothetical protein [Pectobacterium carotovorum]
MTLLDSILSSLADAAKCGLHYTKIIMMYAPNKSSVWILPILQGYYLFYEEEKQKTLLYIIDTEQREELGTTNMGVLTT